MEPDRASPPASVDLRTWLWRVGCLFPPAQGVDAVTTRATFAAPPEDLWRAMLFYEEVPQRPPLLLRLFLPSPLRTDGGEKRVGATVACRYTHGILVKRFTVLEPPHLARFEVLDQRIGVEHCVTTIEGAYEIGAIEGGAEVALTTRYRGRLRPRWLWRRLERRLAHRLHAHILAGMSAKAS